MNPLGAQNRVQMIYFEFCPFGKPFTTQFNPEESLTHEEILLRFKKVLGRDMTPEERHLFFLLPEPPERKPDPQK